MIEIPVTQDDIDKGMPDYIKPDGCVIARVLKRYFGDGIPVLVGFGSLDVYIGGNRDTYRFDEALLRFANAVCDAFHEIEHSPILSGVIRLDKQIMTASYEEKLG